MTSIAFFDFDGTITRGDSFLKFLFYKRRISISLILQVAASIPALLLWKAGIYNNNKAKEKITGYFFRGVDQAAFEKKCSGFATDVLPLMTRQDAMEKIQWHQQHGHTIVVVSASIENYIRHFSSSHQLDYIATRMEVKDSKLTGKFSGKNCYGIEKEIRIKERYQLADYETVYAYGDSRGDREMLALAHKPFFRLFTS